MPDRKREGSFRTVVLISLGQRKAEKMKEAMLRRTVMAMASKLRAYPGVRQVEAVLFESWQDDSKEFVKAPWRPNGVVLLMEARDPKKLDEEVDRVYDAAKEFDQARMRMNPIDGW